ncbi:MAG: NADP-dependent glyceraldehyde-3-phosphate dehydrogenase [Fusobacteriaceae bacterium]|nr:NADP-dependent glyceraldehyde-3-phosphate dehydrogenase [Fusobacteriaceae bacterium]MBP9596692.1 NADP-dependent glyceraldehyde-3-phosphate dehydrogenase [Fusobacteriaceae bacterium]
MKDGNTYKNLLNGKWVTSNSNNLIKVDAPHDNSYIGDIQSMTKNEVDLAFTGARTAFKTWKNSNLSERADILHKAADLLVENADTIANILAREISKDYKSSYSEVVRTADFIKYTAEEAKRLRGETLYGDAFEGSAKNKMSIVTREPLGVVLSIAPFNYPINLSASKIAPALMAGNTVLFKPPTQGAISALYLIEVFRAAGIPEGVINTVTGRGSEIGDYLITHKEVDMVNFTGSSEVGRHIASIAGMIPMIMELGGKDAAIVLDDADLEDTAKNIVSGAFSYSGQRCTAVKRVLVMENVADELTALVKKELEKVKVGMPFDEGVTVTPLIDNKSADFVQSLVDDAIEKGATLVLGNKREKNLIYPTLFDNVTLDMRIAWEEPFGPILPIIRVKSAEEAIEISNKSEYGLQSAVFTSNIDKAFSVAQKLEVGTVHINNKTQRGPDHFPFLGVKSSGMGTQGIRYSIEAMSRPKAIVVNFNSKY